ncbi:Arc family DNA-binding protein [Agrobacterium tumefaciens]|nr:Arc family DNA-binding protein [Agrobacterium tumefaciens]
MSMSRESDKFMLRLPDGMRDRVKAEADQNFRSMNAEIVFQLNRAYVQTETKKADAQAS